jgi:serine/threonine protein phosphatase PrpC
MRLEAACLSHIGQVRQRNEDAIGYFEPGEPRVRGKKGSIFIVADGMGGHRGGEIASQLAVDTVVASYYASRESDPSLALDQAFKEANRVIIEKSRADVSLYGMGTTCTVLVIREREAYVAHVGDSRGYLLRDGNLTQLTEDHSLVGEMVRQGILTDEDARTHPRRNVITRSIGTHDDLSVDSLPAPLSLRDGDVFLLCTDGLTSLVGEKQVKAVLEGNPPRAACDALVDLANDHGGKDNVTVEVVRVLEDR